MHRRDPGALELLNGTEHVELIAVAGIDVGYERDRDGVADAPRVGDHLAHRHEAEVRIAVRGRCTGTRHVGHLEPGLLRQLGGDAVIDTGGDADLPGGQSPLQLCGLGWQRHYCCFLPATGAWPPRQL